MSCYDGLGNNAAVQSTYQDTAEENQAEFIHGLCFLGKDIEAVSKCFSEAVRELIFFYDSDAQAKELCESLERADWRAVCLRIGDKYMAQRGQ